MAESLVTLLEGGVTEPTARQVAEGAGVSLRLVFHHFDDMEDLYREVCQLQFERHWQGLPDVPPDLPLDTRIHQLVADRALRYEQVAVIRRAGLRRSPGSSVIATIIDRSNELLRCQVAGALAPEIAGAGRDPSGGVATGGDPGPTVGGASGELLEALDAATSWSAWEQLRRHQSLPVAQAARIMRRTVTALVAAGDSVSALSSGRRARVLAPATGGATRRSAPDTP